MRKIGYARALFESHASEAVPFELILRKRFGGPCLHRRQLQCATPILKKVREGICAS
jgi:hypothetical protein